MYGKIFESMLEGTLYGEWEAICTFSMMIMLADSGGVVDMTPKVLSVKTSIPLDIVEKGLSVLEKPDPYSRTDAADGRRIELIDAHRPWGWHIVNHEKYSKMVKRDDKLKADRERIAATREKETLAKSTMSQVSQSVASVADVAHEVEVEVEVEYAKEDLSSKHLSEKSDVIAKKKSYPDDFLEFWKLYPSNRRGSKPNALAAWKKMDADASTLISDIQDRFINDERFANDEFIPHCERWIKNCEFESQGKPPSRFGDVTDKNIRTISNWMEK